MITRTTACSRTRVPRIGWLEVRPTCQEFCCFVEPKGTLCAGSRLRAASRGAGCLRVGQRSYAGEFRDCRHDGGREHIRQRRQADRPFHGVRAESARRGSSLPLPWSEATAEGSRADQRMSRSPRPVTEARIPELTRLVTVMLPSRTMDSAGPVASAGKASYSNNPASVWRGAS